MYNNDREGYHRRDSQVSGLFQGTDGDALNAAFREYSAVVAKKKERPSVIQKLRAINPLEQAVKKDRVRHKDKGLEL